MRYLKVLVHRNELHRQVTRVPPWELPLLQALYAGCEVLGEVDVKREPAAPEVEYERLDRKYGEYRNEHGDYTGERVVGAVYGRFETGVRSLAEAMQAALAPAADAPTKARGGRSATASAA